MTRSELVEELSKYPENDSVFISAGGSDKSIEIDDVNHDDYRIFINPDEYLVIGNTEANTKQLILQDILEADSQDLEMGTTIFFNIDKLSEILDKHLKPAVEEDK